jgi:hypothetical protein
MQAGGRDGLEVSHDRWRRHQPYQVAQLIRRELAMCRPSAAVLTIRDQMRPSRERQPSLKLNTLPVRGDVMETTDRPDSCFRLILQWK